MTDLGVSERRACDALDVARSTIRYEAQPEDETNAWLREKLRALSSKHRRYGTPRMTALVRREKELNHKRVERIWQEEGLPVPRKRHRYRPSTPMSERPDAPTGPNEVWCCDFINTKTEYGAKLKILTVLDEFTRESLEIRSERRMRSFEVLETMDELFAERGAPKFLRSDNGSEFTASLLVSWLAEQGVRPIHIEPGCPWQNGYIESFHDKFRSECLNEELFFSRGESQVIFDRWRTEYNEERPHSSLGYLTPAAFAGAVGQSHVH